VLNIRNDADWVEHCMTMVRDGTVQMGLLRKTLWEDMSSFDLSQPDTRLAQIRNKWRKKIDVAAG